MKHLTGLLVTAAVALPTACFAQDEAMPRGAAPPSSTLQIYGRLHLSLNNVQMGASGSVPGARLTALSSDTSWLGFRGTENLGGDLSAFFKAEMLIGVDNGSVGGPLDLGSGGTPLRSTATTAVFNREIHTGLRSPVWGQVSLGTHWAHGVTISARTDPFERVGMGAELNLLQNPQFRGYATLLPNSLQYVTPLFNGVRAKLVVQAPEGGHNRNRAFGLEYTSRRLYAGLTYDDTQANVLSLAPAGTPSGTPALLPGTQPGTRLKNLGVGAAYDFGFAKVSAYVQHNEADGLPDVRGYRAGVQVPVGSGQIRAAFVRTEGGGNSTSLVALRYVHFLSKRTQVYATVARLDNSARSRFGLYPTSLSETFRPTAGGQDSRGFQIGAIHTF